MGQPRDLFLAITAEDGSVYSTNFRSIGSIWETFRKETKLDQPGRKNVSVTVADENQICATDDSLSRQLRYAFGSTGPIRISTGTSPATAAIPSDSNILAVLAIGAPTVPDWSFGLPFFLVKATARRVGDETAGIDAGDLDLGDPAAALDVAGTFGAMDRSYHLCVATESGGLYHAIVGGPGPSRFGNVKVAAGDPGAVLSVACSLGREGLHVCVVNDAGKIQHAIRHPDGTWASFGDVNAATGSSETFSQVSISHYDDADAVNGTLHLGGVTRTGGLFYTNRHAESTPDPLWAPFLDVKSVAGDEGAVTSLDLSVRPFSVG